MSFKIKLTRASKGKKDAQSPTLAMKNAIAPALHKIFYVSAQLLTEPTSIQLRLERFYHPGKNMPTLFITYADKQIMEVLEFIEPRRSWLINSKVCSNGRIYLTTPFDVNFLALHHIRKHCSRNALALDYIHDMADSSTTRILTTFVQPADLQCLADIETVDDMKFYKYNAEKTIAWLAIKTRRTAQKLKEMGVHCGHSAISQNYARSEKIVDEMAQQNDYLRMACDIVGGYIASDLHEELIKYLELQKEIKILVEEKKTAANKRKTLKEMSSTDNKKMKLDENVGAAGKLKNNSDLIDDDESLNGSKNSSFEVKSPTAQPKATPLKERALSAKEKSLAKGAKGTKSISSFFKVK